MPAAAPRPETQEQILAAALASRDERDIPAEDDSWVIVDSDGDRPAELAGLDGAELDELLAATPSRPSVVPGPPGSAGSAGPADAAPGGGSAGLVAGFAEGGVLDVLAPGVALAGCADDAHAGLGGLTDDELVGVLRAWARQESWAQARKLAAIAELARRRPADRTPPAPPGHFPTALSEFTADEVGLALTLTRRSAGAQLDLALALAARSATAALLEAGQIDLTRVRVIIDGIAGLAPGHAAAVEAAVLPEAPGMTSGQLRAAVASAVLAADPDAARKQREEDVKDARVECWADPAGTANLAGRSLPCAQTLAADKRLGYIARIWKKQLAAAWKQAGPDQAEHRPAAGTDLLRARAYLALLLGQPVGAPPADLLPGGAAPAPGALPAPVAPPGPGAHSGPGPYPGPGPHSGPGVPLGSPPYPRPGQPVPAGTGGPGHGTDAPRGAGHSTGAPGGAGHSTGSAGGPSPSPDGEPAAGPPAPDLPPGLRWPATGSGDALPPLAGQVFLTLPLATLLGLSDAPGQAAGYGPIDPDTGRALARAAAGHPAAGWHLIITDPHGRAIGYGHAPRARPAPRHPAPGHPADGWTITLTTERIARGQSP